MECLSRCVLLLSPGFNLKPAYITIRSDIAIFLFALSSPERLYFVFFPDMKVVCGRWRYRFTWKALVQTIHPSMFVSEPLSTNLPLGKNKPRRGERAFSQWPSWPPSVCRFLSHTVARRLRLCGSWLIGVLIKSLIENLRKRCEVFSVFGSRWVQSAWTGSGYAVPKQLCYEILDSSRCFKLWPHVNQAYGRLIKIHGQDVAFRLRCKENINQLPCFCSSAHI